MKKVKIGFLPLYIKLYDDKDPSLRIPMLGHKDAAIAMLKNEGLEVVEAPVCRISAEFMAAKELFNQEQVDAVVTLHLAYSPSLESIGALLACDAPIVVLDSTITYDLYGRMLEADIDSNHGIHGVQDMCNLLKRNGKQYFVEAGHLLHSDVVARVAADCRAIKAAGAYKSARIGLVGKPFQGMGDFYISDEDLKNSIGAQIVHYSPAEARDYLSRVTEEEIDAELEKDRRMFCVEVRQEENYRAAVKTGLALRKWAAEKKLSAYTVSFLDATAENGLLKMPFPELCKAMMSGTGYAGEGDTLTAGLVGALLSVYPDTTFAEVFCPDWKNDLLLLSHMSEMNLSLSSFQPVVADKPFSYAESGDTVGSYGSMRGGSATLVNVAPMGGGKYTLILAPVQMQEIGREHGGYRYVVQGWLKPPMPVADYLEQYSLAGGTHHSALVYGAGPEELRVFGEVMGFDVTIIR